MVVINSEVENNFNLNPPDFSDSKSFSIIIANFINIK